MILIIKLESDKVTDKAMYCLLMYGLFITLGYLLGYDDNWII